MSFPVRISLAGNIAALVLLALLLFDAERLFESRPPAAATSDGAPSPSAAGASQGVLLVVVDGLRVDAAASAAMPELGRLAARGGRGTLELEMQVPATLGAIVAMVEGRIAPPVAVLRDFGSPAAADGGVLERLAARGGRSAVAGTALWHDLYGDWIDGGLAVEGFPDLVADRRIERAARAALADADPPALVVAHLGNVDRVGHRSGGTSPAYAAAVAAADAAIGRLARDAGPDRVVVVTSDHGTTAGGGHAGPERSVRAVPLVVAGPGVAPGALGTRPQSALPALLDAALGLAGPTGASATDHGGGAGGGARDTSAAATASAGPPALAVPWAIAVALAAGVLLVALAGSHALSRESFWLSAALWASVAASALAGGRAGALVAAAALVLGALNRLAGRAVPVAAAAGAGAVADTGVDGGPRSTRRALGVCLVALACGALMALTRLADAGGAEGTTPAFALAGGALGALAVGAALVGRARPPRSGGGRSVRAAAGVLLVLGPLGWWLGGVTLAAAVLVGVTVGWRLARGTRPLFAGIALALLPGLLARLSGETVSLSSVDVAIAHHLVDGPAGLGGAIAAAVLRTALPALALALGWVAGHGSRAAGAAGDSGAAPGVLAAALAAAHTGAGLVFYAALVGGASRADPLHALGLGGLLRGLNELCWVALGVGLGALARAATLALRSDVSSDPRPAGPTPT